MRVAIVQSSYLPWRGYFDIVDAVDLFIFYDDVQFTKRDWRSRNRVKTRSGMCWLTVPVHYQHASQNILTTEIDYGQPWVRRHRNAIHQAYAKAPYFHRYGEDLFGILEQRWSSLAALNRRLTEWAMEALGIRTRLIGSEALGAQGRRTDRLINLLREVGATVYLTGPSGMNYLEPDKFERAGIGLEVKSYDYAPYPQLWGDFVGQVSIIDLLFNTGPDARSYLRSRTPNIRVVEPASRAVG